MATDGHGSIDFADLPVAWNSAPEGRFRQGSFFYEGRTERGVDQLYLYDAQGRVHRFFATAGSRITMQIDSLGQMSFPNDSLNGWLHSAAALLADSVGVEQRRTSMDSLCRAEREDVRVTLLLREHLEAFEDSVFVRRCLGRLSDAAKPTWLMNSIERMLDSRAVVLKSGSRLRSLPQWRAVGDSTDYDLSATRQQMLLIYFWADFDRPSVDSLKMFNRLARQYGLYDYYAKFDRKARQPRHIELFSVCLHAADSASWLRQIEGLEGRHFLLPGGFSHPDIARWRIDRVPAIMVLDRFGTLTGLDLWGDDLRKILNRATVNTQAN